MIKSFRLVLSFFVVISFGTYLGAANAKKIAPLIRRSAKTDQSIPLRQMRPARRKQNGEGEAREIKNQVLPKALRSIHKSAQAHPQLHNAAAASLMPDPFQNFDGMDNQCHCVPPDTNGDVGPNNYVQMVNDSIEVFDKSGNSLLGPELISTLWQGFGGACEDQDNGDPIVLYDQLADRWLVSQFAIFTPQGDNHQCIAISQTGDPTGAYYRYDFNLGVLLNDYPHIGVWPDGYYMTVNQFNPDFSPAGAGVYSFERDRMLLGQSAQLVYFNLNEADPFFGGMLPSDLDGPAPAPGTPNVFAEQDDDAFGVDTDRISLWNFHVDWVNPANSTFGINGQPDTHVDTEPFDANMCDFQRSCIPQPGTNQGLDAITDRLMHRLQYRNFGAYSTIVGNHTVDADGNDHAGIHWFELRNNGSGWGMHQEGIYAPDGDNRWMGSAAMDSAGNIAIGFSVSSSSTFPSIRYVGRLSTDPPGELSQAEKTIIAGNGSQLSVLGRWGDYSGITVDPSAGNAGGIDCDFWYTNEYLVSTGSSPWKTRVGAFTFAPNSCGGPHGDLQGTVTDASAAPITGATITVLPAGFSTTTDSNGHYHFSLPVATYDITASSYGYISQTDTGVVITDGGNITKDFSLQLAPHSVISGTVSDGSGHGWPLYARIDIAGYPFGPIFTNPFTGTYTADLIQDFPYVFHVSTVAPGYNPEVRSVTPPAGGATENFSLSVDFATCNAPGYFSNGGLIEDFNSGTQPSGWSVIDNMGNGQVWTFVNPGLEKNLTGGDGLYAIVNSDFYGVNGEQDTELRTPPLDFTGKSTVQLSFDTDFEYFGVIIAEVGDVDVSIDGGTNWTNVLRYQNQSVPGPHHENVDLSAIAGNHSNVIVRFHYYNAVFAFWWELDNVHFGVQCDPGPGGLLAGNVIDANTGEGLNGAKVVSDDQRSDTVLTFATSQDPNTNDGLYLLFSSLIGSHSFTASKNTYGSQSISVNVVADQLVQQDFNLAAGRLVSSPSQLEDTVPLGNSDTLQLTLSNTGGVAANYKLFENNGTSTNMQSGVRRPESGAPLRQIQGHFSPLNVKAQQQRKFNHDKKETKEDSPLDSSAWTSIAEYPIYVEDNTCVELNAKIYCIGGIDPHFVTQNSAYVYDPASDSWSAIANMTGERDKPAAAVINGKIYVAGGWDSSGGPVDTLEIYDPGTDSWSAGASMPKAYAALTGISLNNKFYLIGGCDIGSCGFNDVQVYDPVADSWSTAAEYPDRTSWISCGVIDGLLYCAGGTNDNQDTKHTFVYDPTTDAWTRLADLPQTMWGSGYTVSDNQLYISGGVTNNSSTITNQGFAYNPSNDTWSPIPNSQNTLYRGGSACGFYRIGGDIDLAVPLPLSEVLPGLTNCSGSVDVPWLGENPDQGIVASNSQQQIDVTFDASKVSQPGDYPAHLRIKEDTPYATPDVQVLMHVPLPAGWGYLSGTVTGLGRCDQTGAALSKATVSVDANGTIYTQQTDANGQYTIAFDASISANITVTADGYVTQNRANVQITAGNTHNEDFNLRLDSPCLAEDSTLLEDTVDLGSSADLQFSLTNTGAGQAAYRLIEGHENTAQTTVAKLDASPWMEIANYPTTIYDTSCAEIEGLVYCVGGVEGRDGNTKKGAVYNPSGNTWSALPEMSIERQKPAVVAIDGLLYVTGGYDQESLPIASLEIYDPITNTWSEGSPIPNPYADATGVSLNGKFYVIGGCEQFVCNSAKVQVYDPVLDKWTQAADYPEPISWAACGAINGLIYCTAGQSEGVYVNQTYVYDPGSDSWSQLADFPMPLWGSSYAVSDGLLYVIGGINDPSVDEISKDGFVYDPTTDSWSAIPQARNTLFRSGSACGFYKIGGLIGGLNSVPRSEVYSGLTNCGTAIDIPWLSENPKAGNIDADTGQQSIDVNFNAANVTQPGDYKAHLRIQTAYQIPDVQVVMHVPLPADWGTVQGTITGLGRCDVAGQPLHRATVVVHTSNQDYTLITDAAGNYHVSFPIADGPAEITVDASGYVEQVRANISVIHSSVNVQNFDLRKAVPCADKSPASMQVNLSSGQKTTLPLTIKNLGAGDLHFEIRESTYSLPPLRPGHFTRSFKSGAAGAPACHGSNCPPTPSSISSLHFRKANPVSAQPSSAWFTGLPVPGGLARYAHAQCDNQQNSFYVFAGIDGVNFTTVKNSWRYDATTNTWNALAPIPNGGQSPIATCYQDRIYVMGGSLDTQTGTTQMFIYDVLTDTWSDGAPLPRPMLGAATAAWNGKVYLAGGDPDFLGSGTSSEVDIYDIASNTWEGTASPMPVPAVMSGFVQAGPDLYVVGGWIDGVAPFSNNIATQKFNMDTDTWTTGPDLPSGRADMAVAITDKALYSMGGDDDGNFFFDGTKTVTRLDLSSWPDGSWSDLGSELPLAYTANSGGFCTEAIAAGSEIWSLGGLTPNSIDGTNFFHPLNTEHCFSIYSDVKWLSEAPDSGTISADSSGNVDLNFDATNLSSGTYNAVLVVSTTDPGAPQFQIPITLRVGMFADDFNDGDYTSPLWKVKGGTWSASTGDLAGKTTKKADAFSPSFGNNGCTKCTVRANVAVNTAGETLSLFGWRADSNNYVEIDLNTNSGTLSFRQKAAGSIVAKHSVAVPLPVGDYAIELSYDGSKFHLDLSGAATRSFSLNGGANPHGLVAFRVKSSGKKVTGTLKDITVF